MSGHIRCENCKQSFDVPSRIGYGLLYALAWLVALVGPLLLFGVLALFAVAILPIGVLATAGMLGPLHERVFGQPRCPTCKRVV